ncbi:MAG: 16S rRNA (uracil(1498)-N(3))-methyltransferase [Bdellovibrionaceae bacterium]|nr:16S rRNA (uracil(1498)-N(3))-methyltransferase [Pseudobdellovibrionaceae bacterium]MBX3034421.1 16S rRNA (uracil(1498)-N(3))-methyltransferase [Pseudobdellovibrionaceae bacterium]
MRRYWIESRDKNGEVIQFQGDVFHHVFDVCRQAEGSKFEVLTEEGKAYFVEVTNVGRKSAQARVLEERLIPPLKEPLIHLVLSVPRFPVMEAVLEKAVELGVKSVQPVFSEFSFVRSANSLSDGKWQRWEKIIRSATQQCGRGEKMLLHEPHPLENFLAEMNRNGAFEGLFAYEGGSTLGIKAEIQNIKARNPRGLKEIFLFVGSEGGFSHAEVEMFQRAKLTPVTLGAQVLRVETACMALVSVLKYDFDLMC